jgi:hypothetical protein
MSMPFLAFTCTGCEFKGSSMAVWGQFSYDSAGKPVPMKRRLAWCTSCEDLVPLEVLPNETTIRELESEIAHTKEVIANFMSKAEQQKSWLQRLAGSSVKMSAEMQDVDTQRSYREDELKGERARASFLAARRSAPKCMFCGGKNCLEFPIKISPRGTDRMPGPPASIGMKHPSCGGDFMVEHSGIRISKRLSHRLYDCEGTFLKVLEDS